MSIFTETIDWQGGDDPQYRSVLPVTEADAAALVGAKEEELVAALEALGRARRHLQDDWPQEEPRRIAWVAGGLRVGPFD